MLINRRFLYKAKHYNKTLVKLFSSKSESNNVIKSEFGDIVLPNVSTQEFMFDSMKRFGKYVAVESFTTGKKYSYDQIITKSSNLGKALRKHLKLKTGDVVLLLMHNSPDFTVAAMGILAGGFVISTVNPMYTPDEISKQLLDCNPKAIVTQSIYNSNVQKALLLTRRKCPVVIAKNKETDSLPDGTISFEELILSKINDLPDLIPVDSDVTAVLPYSSGTTGLPKGVVLNHYNIVSNVLQCAHEGFNTHNLPTGNYQDIVPLILPCYHFYGFAVIMLYCLINGSRMVTLPKFTPDGYCNLLKTRKPTHLYAAPPLILFMISTPDLGPSDFSNVQLVMSAAAPLGYSDELRLKEKFKNDKLFLRQGYGLTETSPILTLIPKGTEPSEKIGGSIGKFIPNTWGKFIDPSDPEGVALGPNEPGELLVKGPQVMQGYLNKPEDTEKAFLNGWFRTGDIGYYNKEGFLFITDRLKELIKVKGYQVAPAELEEVIRSFPAIEDTAVIGIDDPRQGEVPRAYVVVKNGHKFQPEELQRFVAEKVAKYKQLVGGVEVVDIIPRNPSGKILRRQLKLANSSKNV